MKNFVATVLSEHPCPHCGRLPALELVNVIVGFHRRADCYRICCKCGLGTPNFSPSHFKGNHDRAISMALRFWGYYCFGENFERKYPLLLVDSDGEANN